MSINRIVAYQLILIEGKSINSNVKELYYKVQAIKTKAELGENEELLSLNDYSTKGCTYLKYWLYDQIITIGFDEDKTKALFNLWEQILKNNFEFIIDQKRTCKFHIIELKDIKKIKLLFDYLLNYNFDQNEHDIYNIICENGYKDCLNRIIDTYNNSVICEDEYSENFCKELEECNDVYGKRKLPKLRCEGNKGSLIYPRESNGPSTDEVSSLSVTSETDSPRNDSPEGSTVQQSENGLTNKKYTVYNKNNFMYNHLERNRNNHIIGEKNDKYWDIIKNDLEEYSWAKDICHKLERNLSVFLDNQTDESNISNKRCYDVSYWLYEKVYKQLRNDDNGQIFLTIFANLQSAWLTMNKDKTITQQNVCNSDINLYKITYVEEMNLLFDYIEYFETIKEDSIKDPSDSCQKCFEYLSSPIPLYFLWKPTCQKDDEINS
ncbi:hypothetical protein PVMG_06225 [Plasmodium vivax Mauritania I]|uniref:Uncharacterized protein n=2 Tax=Plasmodium vivax TaxID=5855 RepID=A0A0J9T2I6_PLAVI|nr:hypothetical protein PVMG_06225 [Plasmodium vivax Mauritania I]KMZ96467.1 hypothetical protein PVNG_06393 [Plasmodium vivax North Korean]